MIYVHVIMYMVVYPMHSLYIQVNIYINILSEKVGGI